MARNEQSPRPSLTELQEQLAEVEEQLIQADENENTIERTSRREELQEEEDWLLYTIDSLIQQS